MNLTLHIWRQKSVTEKGKMVEYKLDDVSPDISFLEMLDILNLKLIDQGEEPVAFDHDCREGICGMCSCMINGKAHGPEKLTTTCQLHMRKFKDGDHIVIEPWRAKPFKIIRDLVVDRSAMDRIIQSGGFVSVNTGSPQDANALPVSKEKSETAMDAAACLGCGACVAQCKNASAMLFVSAKITQFANLPQGQPERLSRVKNMIEAMDKEGFGCCSNHFECEATCPVGIKIPCIAQMNRDFMRAQL
jgi:succinate dehydrogenase / fumarate reductase iron-sulfur subunit